MRRRKNDNEPPPQEDAPENEEPEEQPDAFEERLAPIEEFRGKADNWMKEASAQLDRVASHVQQDEKRQEHLDRRLAEFEERIQAMLMLTETLSQEDNPFVRSPDAPPLSKSHAASPEHEDAPRPATLVPNEDPGTQSAPMEHPRFAHEEEGEPAGTEMVRPFATDPAAQDEAVEDETNPFLEPDGPVEDPASGPVDPPRVHPRVHHPNDAAAEQTPPEPPSVDHGIRPITDTWLEEDAAREAERRLILLQWASLLARHLHRIDIDTFLETYLRTGWIDHPDIEKVRALAADLTRTRTTPTERFDREDLHIRSVLLLTRLNDRRSRTDRSMEEIVHEAKALAEKSWAPGAT